MRASVDSCARASADFLVQWAAHRAGFPLGVDLIFVADARLAALPRSTAIIEGTG